MTTDLYGDLRDAPAPLGVPESALAIGAHPDDIEFGAGGTLARWAAAGCRVTLLVITDGSKGTWDPSVPQHDLVTARRREQEAAAAVLGASDVVHLDRPDGELEMSIELRGELCRWIRKITPHVLLGHDPWKPYEMHPDHRIAGMSTVDAVVAARDHLFFPDQGLAPHRPQALLLWGAEAPDHIETIDSTFDRKVAALRCHSSQSTTTMGGAGDSDAAAAVFEDRLRSMAQRAAHGTEWTMAEAFKRLTP